MNSSSFTIKWDNRVNQLITDCHITLPVKDDALFDASTLEGFKALWDTGATGTVISKAVADKLGLIPTGKTVCHHAAGSSNVNVYDICIALLNKVAIPLLRVTEGTLNGFDVLIGMDIIGKGDFSISNFNNQTVFSFRFPSAQETDFVKEHKIAELKKKHSGRNSSNSNRTPPKKKRRK